MLVSRSLHMSGIRLCLPCLSHWRLPLYPLSLGRLGALSGSGKRSDALPKLPECIFGLSDDVVCLLVHFAKLESSNGGDQ